jgi:DNA-directed RNA polymerase alpha subunit
MESWRERNRRARAQQRRWKVRLLATTLEQCEVWQAVVNNLKDHGITTLGDLTRCTRAQVAAFPYIGPKKMQELDDVLYRYDLTWSTEHETNPVHSAGALRSVYQRTT